jgi:hypothetical protein
MTGEGGIVLKDGKDFGMNCVVPWVEFTGGDVVLMELKKKIEVRAGDAFFFRGECITHKIEAVHRVRELADFFTHKNMLDYCEKKRAGRGGTRRKSSDRRISREKQKYQSIS